MKIIKTTLKKILSFCKCKQEVKEEIKEELKSIIIPKDALEGKEDLYNILMEYHTKAVNENSRLVYPKNMILHLDIPTKPATIPLPINTNFNGCKIIVKNTTSKYHTLFLLTSENETPVKIGCDMINSGDYSSSDKLNTGLKLLRIKDRSRWTHRAPEEGDYDIFRQEVIVIKDGKALNKPTIPYDKRTSNPEGYYVNVNDTQKVISNLTLERSEDSTECTRLIKVTLQNNVKLKNIKISTPFVPEDSTNQMYKEDYCIRIMNSSNIYFEDVEVRGTYTIAKTWGYAVNLENVYNSNFLRFNAEAHWGVFGNNNVNTATLTDCRINRFDLHCYGRDVTCIGCTFDNKIDDSHPDQVYCKTNVLNAFGSMYGTLRYENCHFIKSRPVYLRSHYRAFTGFDIIFKNCTLDMHPNFSYIVTTGLLDEVNNTIREELKDKCWPNLTMQDCKINIPNNVKTLHLFFALRDDKSVPEINYLSLIDLNNLTINSSGLSLIASNAEVKTSNQVEIKLKNIPFDLDRSMLK